jgi:hypothetical protein
MIPGFVKMDRARFCSEVWGAIKNKVDAVESNWAAAKHGQRPIIIKWGYKDEATGEKVIVAITRADDDGEEYWVEPSLVSIG